MTTQNIILTYSGFQSEAFELMLKWHGYKKRQSDSCPLLIFKSTAVLCLKKLLKLNDIIKQSNILFTHNAINGNTPDIFKDYFTFNEGDHLHNTANNLNSVYSIPKGSIQLQNLKNECSIFVLQL